MERYIDRMGRILSELDSKTVSGLADRIILALEKRKRKLAGTKAAIFGVLSAGSLAGLYFLVATASAQFSASGTPQLFSLVFTDFGVVMANFGDYFASILESLPLLPVVGVLSLVLTLFVSLIFSANNFKEVLKAKLHYAGKYS